MKSPETQIRDLLESSRIEFLAKRPKILKLEWDLYQIIKKTGINPNIRIIENEFDVSNTMIKMANKMVSKRQEEIVRMFDTITNNVGVCLLSSDKSIRVLTNFVLERKEDDN